MIAAIDPGKHACGWAVYGDGSILRAGYGPKNVPTYLLDVLYFEVPQIYPGARKEDPNDCIAVTLRGALFTRVWNFKEFIELHPRDWKGSVNPDSLIRRIKDKILTARERAIVEAVDCPESRRHNVYDACGILLHVKGRLEF